MNYFKDEEEDWEKYKLLCRFLNPDAAAQIFDEKVIEKSESTDDVLFESMSKDLKGKYSTEELKEMMQNPKRFRELDRIEKV